MPLIQEKLSFLPHSCAKEPNVLSAGTRTTDQTAPLTIPAVIKKIMSMLYVNFNATRRLRLKIAQFPRSRSWRFHAVGIAQALNNKGLPQDPAGRRVGLTRLYLSTGSLLSARHCGPFLPPTTRVQGRGPTCPRGWVIMGTVMLDLSCPPSPNSKGPEWDPTCL